MTTICGSTNSSSPVCSTCSETRMMSPHGVKYGSHTSAVCLRRTFSQVARGLLPVKTNWCINVSASLVMPFLKSLKCKQTTIYYTVCLNFFPWSQRFERYLKCQVVLWREAVNISMNTGWVPELEDANRNKSDGQLWNCWRNTEGALKRWSETSFGAQYFTDINLSSMSVTHDTCDTICDILGWRLIRRCYSVNSSDGIVLECLNCIYVHLQCSLWMWEQVGFASWLLDSKQTVRPDRQNKC